jgi:hypothetical protein
MNNGMGPASYEPHDKDDSSFDLGKPLPHAVRHEKALPVWPSSNEMSFRYVHVYSSRRPSALEGRKENSPGQAERSPGYDVRINKSPDRGARMTADLVPFCRPSRAQFLLFSQSRASEAQPGATLLPPSGELREAIGSAGGDSLFIHGVSLPARMSACVLFTWPCRRNREGRECA